MSTDVPVALRRWFVVHFVADITFAIPLLLAPRQLGELLGHSAVDPLTARMVAAALVGIGVESFLGRNDSRASFLTMLRLKVLWAGTAIAGAIAGYAETQAPVYLLVLGIFGPFCALWAWWFRRLGSAP